MKEVKFKLDRHIVTLKFVSKGGDSSIVGFTRNSSATTFLNIATPQFEKESVLKVPVVMLPSFRAGKTIEGDISSLGFSSVKIKDKVVGQGHLYYWQTPTKGSASYYYLQNPKIKTLALKIGPFADLVKADFTIDWENAKWKRISIEK